MKSISKLLLCALLLSSAGPLPAAGSDDDVYKEDAIKPFLDRLPEEVPQPEEEPVVIPPYPLEKNLVKMDIDRYGYAYQAYVDTASLSVGKDRVVRYTVVLRSPAGVDNVSYEGLRCTRNEFKRYAYGSGGRFYPVTNPDWQRIHQVRQDIYRKVLADEYLCPIPGGNQVAQILARFERSTRDRFPGDRE
jgi:CNP1-like family